MQNYKRVSDIAKRYKEACIAFCEELEDVMQLEGMHDATWRNADNLRHAIVRGMLDASNQKDNYK